MIHYQAASMTTRVGGKEEHSEEISLIAGSIDSLSAIKHSVTIYAVQSRIVKKELNNRLRTNLIVFF